MTPPAHKNRYPPRWPQIARGVKEASAWRCERCGAPHGSSPNVLTVHHLDNDKANVEPWNLAALCQRCHLHVQATLNVYQLPLLDHEPWLEKHLGSSGIIPA